MVCSRYPKESRYYEQLLKKKCFRKLKYNVWERKTKWILLRRADIHYRKKLLCKCINLWLTYLNESYKKKINRRAAECFYEEKLKSRGLLGLKKNVEEGLMVMRICKNKFEWNLKYKCWHQWKHYVEKRLKVREVKILANRIREERLIIRFFYLWLFRFNEKRSLQETYELAVVKSDTKLKNKYLKAWKLFTDTQNCKRKIESLAKTCYEEKLKEKFLYSWKRYTFQRKRYRYQMIIIETFYKNYLLTNYLTQWHAAYKELKLERKICNLNLAVNFHERKLLEKTFRIFLKVREKKRAHKEKVEIFRIIYIKIYLDIWSEKRKEKIQWNNLESKATKWREDFLLELYLSEFLEKYQRKVEEREEMMKVMKYYNTVIMHKAFRGWYEATERKISSKIEFENASKFYSEKLTKNTFKRWKSFLEKKLRKKTAIEYYKFILLSRAMEEWKTYFSKRKKKLKEAEKLEQQHNIRFIKRIFEKWKYEAIVSKSKLSAAAEFYKKSKLLRSFNTWNNNTRVRVANKIRYNRNKTVLDNTIIRNSILLWYEVLKVKKNLEMKLQEVKLRREKRLLKFCCSAWHGFALKMKNLRQTVDLYPQIRLSILIEEYLDVLLKAVKTQRTFKGKEKFAKKTEEKLVKRRYFRKWLSFIHWKKERLLKCVSEDVKTASKENVEVLIPLDSKGRRKPMIPGYLKADFDFVQFGGLKNYPKRKASVRRCSPLSEI